MEKIQDHIYALILCGGGGTRLWPYSREHSPKQFLKLFGGKSLFQLSLERAQKITSPSRIFIVTTSAYASYVRNVAKPIPSENIIIEPMRRDTAMATALGVSYIFQRDPQSIVVNLASDHLISPMSTFTSQILEAAHIAFTSGKFVDIGIKPTFPNTGLGHIKIGKKKNVGEKFVEKPDLELAKKYTSSGNYLWNTNIFIFTSKLMLNLLKKHAPKIYTFLPKILANIGTTQEKHIIHMAYQLSPSISIDYAIAEKLKNFVCLTAKFNWTDIGDWKAVWQNLPQDKLGNSILGTRGQAKYIGEDSQNNLLMLNKRLVATIGLHDMVIIDTSDALLICPKDMSQSVKQIVQMLKSQGLTKYI